MTKGKRFARAVAKLYVAELLRSSDMPEWMEQFIDIESAEALEFEAELQRISERLYAQVPAKVKALLRSIAPEPQQ